MLAFQTWTLNEIAFSLCFIKLFCLPCLSLSQMLNQGRLCCKPERWHRLKWVISPGKEMQLRKWQELAKTCVSGVNPICLHKNTFFVLSLSQIFQHCKSLTWTSRCLKWWIQFGWPVALNILTFWTGSTLVFKEKRKKNKPNNIRLERAVTPKELWQIRWPSFHMLNLKSSRDIRTYISPTQVPI